MGKINPRYRVLVTVSPYLKEKIAQKAKSMVVLRLKFSEQPSSEWWRLINEQTAIFQRS